VRGTAGRGDPVHQQPGGVVPPERQSLRERRAAAARLRRIAMFNEAHVSLMGYVATQPKWRETRTGIPNLTMRVAWTPRRLDKSTGEWVDGLTSYVTVICWRKLADNIATCLRKGDPVLVQGRLSVRPYDDKEGVRRVVVEVDANSVGHDLSRGVAQFQRVRPPTGKTAAEHAAALEAGAAGEHDGLVPSPDQDQAGTLSGTAELAELAGPSELTGPAESEMFDEGAISALAREADGAAVPF
jgi:single-strand DNA-binding protein